MAYRIAIGEVAHETNTFCAAPTTTAPFKEYQWLHGDEIVRVHGGNRTYVGGMLAQAEELGVAAVPAFTTMAYPSGTITAAAYEEIVATLAGRHRARDAGGCDLPRAPRRGRRGGGGRPRRGDPRGGARAVRHGDTRRRLARSARQYHPDRCSNTRMACSATGFYPHTDSYERGAEAMTFLYRMLQGEIRPVMHLEQLPMMIPTCSTDLEPGKRLNALCREWEERPGMIDCTIFHGFAYTDVPAVGISVLTITDNDPALAAEAGKAVARGDLGGARGVSAGNPHRAAGDCPRPCRAGGPGCHQRYLG